MGSRSRLRPRPLSGWGAGLRTHNLVASTADGPVRSSVVGHRVLPYDPLGRACSGTCEAPDEFGGKGLLKIGILGVAAIFPAGEVSDHCSPQDGVGSVARVAERELVGGGALVEELSKWRGELRVLGGHQGSQSSGGSREGEQAGAYSGLPPEEPDERGYR